MPVNPADHTDVAALRAQLLEYERIFTAAAPRLAAFRRLEEIARQKRLTPEAVAAEAALEVPKREQAEVAEQLARTKSQRDELEKEVAMLVNRKAEEIEILDDLKIENHEVHMEVGEMLDELRQLREDGAKLMSERSDLELHVRALKLEIAHLEKRRAELGDELPHVVGAPGKFSREFDLSPDEDDEESDRFDRFFHAQVEHDKARDWILG